MQSPLAARYVQAVIDSHRTDPTLGARIRLQMLDVIRSWAGRYLLGLTVSGSRAKGTANLGGTDLDLFISLSPNTPESLGQIYWKLYEYLEDRHYQVRQQNVSVGVNWNGFQVDLVPGKKRLGDTHYHSLYKSKNDSWTQTNVVRHVNLVRNSGRLREIRALKIWRDVNRLEFPSLLLELSVIQALRGRAFGGNLAEHVIVCLDYFENRLGNARVVDPANTNNVLTDDLTTSELAQIARTAGTSRVEPNWRDILW